MNQQKRQVKCELDMEQSFLESQVSLELFMPTKRSRRHWSFDEIYQQLQAVIQANPAIQTLEDYKQWRSQSVVQSWDYPSVDTIYRLKLLQLEKIKQLFEQGQVGRPVTWNEERIWACVKRAYEASQQLNQPFTPKFYRQWQQEQVEKTPSYSTINEVVGSFKDIRAILEVQDHRFNQGSNRPKRWTEDMIWGFLEKAAGELHQEGLELTQQTFLNWRERQLQQNIAIPALSTIKSILGRGGFMVWRKQLKE